MTDERDSEKDDTSGTTWRSARVAQALSEGLNLTSLFAAPKALERWRSTRARHPRHNKESMLKQLDELGTLFQAEPEILGKGAMQQAPKLFAELRKLLEGWDEEATPSAELVAKARATLTALGLPEPPGGWQSYMPDE